MHIVRAAAVQKKIKEKGKDLICSNCFYLFLVSVLSLCVCLWTQFSRHVLPEIKLQIKDQYVTPPTYTDEYV